MLFPVLAFWIIQTSMGFRMGKECKGLEAGRSFQCLSEPTLCIAQRYICDGGRDCHGSEDEENCGYMCGYMQFRCTASEKCISSEKLCDGTNDCGDNSDESCEGYAGFSTILPVTTTTESTTMESSTPKPNQSTFTTRIDVPTTSGPQNNYELQRRKLVSWFVGQRRTSGTPIKRWDEDLQRTAVALFWGDKNFFAPNNTTGNEIRYELVIDLLSRFNKFDILETQELALYINAMQAACLDPRNFFGKNLLQDLRAKVNREQEDVFGTLVLCSADGEVSQSDLTRLGNSFKLSDKPVYTDVTALKVLALHCLAKKTGFERSLKYIASGLKQLQASNGTVGGLRSTALVLQALTATNDMDEFNRESALNALVSAQRADGSIGSALDSYYALGALSGSSLLDVNMDHCTSTNASVHMEVGHSVWLGSDQAVLRSWKKLRVPSTSSCYDVLEAVSRMDSSHQVKYEVMRGKLFVSSVIGIEEDPERNTFWFTYIQRNGRVPEQFTGSLTDQTLNEGDELVLWRRQITKGDKAPPNLEVHAD